MPPVLKTLATSVVAVAFAVNAKAADEVNVAFFLGWATPNMIAKAEGTYDELLGSKVNWASFDSGSQMTKAMLAGEIDISYSQGLAPFISAVNAGAPIKTIAVAVTYPANPCIVASRTGITADNAVELKGRTVAVPFATMAEYSFRMQMRELDVDLTELTIVNQMPTDAVQSLIDGSVDMVCIFGGDSIKTALELGANLMSSTAMAEAGIVAFDVVSVTEKFAKENPQLVQGFMNVTDEINKSFAKDQSKIDKIEKESGLDMETTMYQMSEMLFPTKEQQVSEFFGGRAASAFEIAGSVFANEENPARDDYRAVIDTSFLR